MRPAKRVFSRGRFSIWPRILIIMGSYKRTSNISFSGKSPFYDRTLTVESRSQQRNTNDFESCWTVFSCLKIAKDATHVVEECFAQFCLYLSSIVLILQGNSHTVISVSQFWFHFDDKMEELHSLRLYRATSCFTILGYNSKCKPMLKNLLCRKFAQLA